MLSNSDIKEIELGSINTSSRSRDECYDIAHYACIYRQLNIVKQVIGQHTFEHEDINNLIDITITRNGSLETVKYLIQLLPTVDLYEHVASCIVFCRADILVYLVTELDCPMIPNQQVSQPSQVSDPTFSEIAATAMQITHAIRKDNPSGPIINQLFNNYTKIFTLLMSFGCPVRSLANVTTEIPLRSMIMYMHISEASENRHTICDVAQLYKRIKESSAIPKFIMKFDTYLCTYGIYDIILYKTGPVNKYIIAGHEELYERVKQRREQFSQRLINCPHGDIDIMTID